MFVKCFCIGIIYLSDEYCKWWEKLVKEVLNDKFEVFLDYKGIVF